MTASPRNTQSQTIITAPSFHFHFHSGTDRLLCRLCLYVLCCTVQCTVLYCTMLYSVLYCTVYCAVYTLVYCICIDRFEIIFAILWQFGKNSSVLIREARHRL